MDEEKQWWRIPIVTDFLQKHGLETALTTLVGSETVQARQFVEFAFGKLKSLNDAYLHKDWLSNGKEASESVGSSSVKLSSPLAMEESISESSSNDRSGKDNEKKEDNDTEKRELDNGQNSSTSSQAREASESDKQFWKKLADTVNQNVVQRLGLPAPEKIKWDGFDMLNKIGLQSRKIAEAGYIESGLATPQDQGSSDSDATVQPPTTNTNQLSLLDIQKATQDVLRQTDAVLGALMILNAGVSKLSKGAGLWGKQDTEKDASAQVKNNYDKSKSSTIGSGSDALVLDEKKAEEMRALFSKAESAMEAWALLATSLGHPSFIKSEFEKICFLDNPNTDTQASSYFSVLKSS